MAKTEKKLIANNKKAYHDYFILEKYEVGLVLHGTEVKSLRMGKCSIKESFIRVEDGEMYIYGMHISPYEKGNIFNKDPLRVRKLLLHKKEILKISGKMKEQGINDFCIESRPHPAFLEKGWWQSLDFIIETKERIEEADIINALIYKHLKDITAKDVTKYIEEIKKAD